MLFLFLPLCDAALLFLLLHVTAPLFLLLRVGTRISAALLCVGSILLLTSVSKDMPQESE
jgi:hypothetical protein